MADIYNMADTWNNGATTFTAIKMNVTDTASAAASLLMDLQVGGTSKFAVTKGGAARVSAGAKTAPGLSFLSRPGAGFYQIGTVVCFADVNADIWWTGASNIVMRSNGSYGWSSGTTVGGGLETYMDRAASGIIRISGPSAAAGTLQFGTHTTLGGESVTGYITVKDHAGNDRKLAVVS